MNRLYPHPIIAREGWPGRVRSAVGAFSISATVKGVSWGQLRTNAVPSPYLL